MHKRYTIIIEYLLFSQKQYFKDFDLSLSLKYLKILYFTILQNPKYTTKNKNIPLQKKKDKLIAAYYRRLLI